MKICHFAIDRARRRRRQRGVGASAGLAALVVCLTHPTDRNWGGVVMPRAFVEAAVAIVTFLLGIPPGWSCLLFKTSGVSFFSGTGNSCIVGFPIETRPVKFKSDSSEK